MEYEVWADAFPDEPSFSARIVRVMPELLYKGHSAVMAMTCVPRGRRDMMPEMVEDLFRVFVDLPDSDEVRVHLTWLDQPPADLLE